MEEVVSWWNPS